MGISWSVATYDALSSTQDFLMDLVADDSDLSEGQVVHALSQTEGRGRQGRVWEGGDGNLYFSFLLRPGCVPGKIGQLSLLTGLAVFKVIDGINKSKNKYLKWPNDILVEEKKCCGILIDASPVKDNKIDALVIGIGINLQTAPLETSTFLQKYSKTPIIPESFMMDVLSHFSACYTQWQENGFDVFKAEWLSRTYPVGSEVHVKMGQQEIKGRFETIDDFGNLVLFCDKSGEQKKITSGDVFLI